MSNPNNQLHLFVTKSPEETPDTGAVFNQGEDRDQGVAGGALPEVWHLIHKVHISRSKTVIASIHRGLEEGYVIEIDDVGFRLSPSMHWFWWFEVTRAEEIKR